MFFIELCLFESHKLDMSLAWRVSVCYTEMPHYTVWRDRLTKRDMTHQPNGMSSLRNLSHAVCLKKIKKGGAHSMLISSIVGFYSFWKVFLVQSGLPLVFDNKPCKYKFVLLYVLSCRTIQSWVPPQYLANLCRNPIYLQHLWHGDLS